MKLPYKLQQFWLRQRMWEWTFCAWQNLMFPHINSDNSEERVNRIWFWQYLNNFEGDLDESL
jgi:hypothetical protein